MLKRQKKKKETLSEKWFGGVDIPEDVLLHVPRITMMDNQEVRIENYQTVLEYEENKIQFACKYRFLTITGKGLMISLITDDEVNVRGEILTVQFS